MEGNRYAATPRSRREPGVAAEAARAGEGSERAIALAPGGDGAGRICVGVGNDGCVRVRAGATGPEDPRRGPWRPARLQRRERDDGGVVVAASGQRTRLEIEPDPFRMRLVGRDAAPIAALLELVCEPEGAVRAVLALPPEARVHGAGDVPGAFERRGARLRAGAGSTARFPSPFLLVHRPGPDGPGAWGVLVDAAQPQRVELDVGAAREDALGVATGAGGLDLWILPGPRPRDVLARLAARLGFCALPPRWALGHHVATDAKTVRAAGLLVDRVRARGFPLDALHHAAVGRAPRLARRAADPPDLVAAVCARGSHSVVRVAPDVRVDPEDPLYRDGLARGVFLCDADGRLATRRSAARPDLGRPEVRRWWSERHRPWIESGAAGFWNEVPSLPGGSRRGGPPGAGEPGLHATRQAEAARRALEAARPAERPFVLTEAGGPGIAREAAILASAEPDGWDGLRARITRLLSLSICGAAFCGADLAGPATPELFARAVQLAALQPFLRSRGGSAERALARGRLGPRIDAIARDAFALRERLHPYLYGLLRACEETGAPVWRPLFYAFPDDADAAAVDDQVMIGPALLAAPVCERGAREREVYLPPGEWFAWHDRALYRGPRRLRVAAPLERLPLFVRAGSVLPTRAPQTSPDADAEGLDAPSLEIFPGRDCAFDWTEDDGETLAYRDGAFARTAVRLWSRPAGRLRVELGRREGSFRPATRAARLVLHACPPPRRVLLDGAPLREGGEAPGYRMGNGELEVRLADVDRGAAVEVEPSG